MDTKNVTGLTVDDYRRGFGRDRITYGFAETPLGWIITAWYDNALCWFSFATKMNDIVAVAKLQMFWPYNELIQDDVRAIRLASHIFDGDRLDISCNQSLSILLKGRPFQMKVWRELVLLEPLEMLTYGEMARRIEVPGAAQAVGQALNKNPIGVIVPCHRVMASDGKGGFDMGGFAYGVNIKEQILKMERVL